MATTRLRDAVGGLTRRAERDLSAVWRATDDAARAGVALHDLLPALVDQYGAAAAAMAAEWYDDLREKSGVPGRFRAIPADIADTGTHALVGWAQTEATDYESFKTLVVGGVQRRVADWSRLTVSGSAVKDPHAQGWRRVGSGGCDFCKMLLSRGAVYSESTASFKSHDHCGCSAEPVWR